MSKFQSFVFCFLSLVLFLSVANVLTPAQSTIFNIPSTDILQKKSFYIEGDFISHLDSYQNGGFQTYGYRTVYGVNKRFEVGFNLFYTRNGRVAPIEFQPNLKFKVYENEKYGVSATTGVLVVTSLNRVAGSRTSAQVYANVSKVIKQTKGTRVTGGFYTIGGGENDFGTKNGVTVGLEQPVKGKFTFIGDWSSGNNRYGYSTAGLNYAFTKRQFLLLGYNFGNSGRGNNAISAFYGLTF